MRFYDGRFYEATKCPSARRFKNKKKVIVFNSRESCQNVTDDLVYAVCFAQQMV